MTSSSRRRAPVSTGDLQVTTLRERADLADAMWAIGPHVWPPFMMEDPVGDLYYGRVVRDFPDTCLLVLADDEIVARAFYLPFTAPAGAVEDGDWTRLPDRGWDGVIEAGVADHDAGRDPTAASALEIGILPAWRGRGVSSIALAAMRSAVAARGLHDLVAPVRPSGKHLHPTEHMDDYLARTTGEGLPADPWLRVHVRAGGQVVKVAPVSMRIEGTMAEWERWAGRSLDTDGPAVVDGALQPVHVDAAADLVTYVEPNVWVHHDLRDLLRPR